MSVTVCKVLGTALVPHCLIKASTLHRAIIPEPPIGLHQTEGANCLDAKRLRARTLPAPPCPRPPTQDALSPRRVQERRVAAEEQKEARGMVVEGGTTMEGRGAQGVL